MNDNGGSVGTIGVGPKTSIYDTGAAAFAQGSGWGEGECYGKTPKNGIELTE